MTRLVWRLGSALAVSALAVTAALAIHRQAGAQAPTRDPQIGRSFLVPYRLTDTNHFLVRVRINGKGPFNFLVDSGAPALFVATETAKQVGLKPARDRFWTPIDRFDIEGGSRLANVKARVEDPFQLVGMNALGLPGASIDGILGFTILARYRLEIDPTQDRMTWTRLNYEPREPPVPHRDDERAPAGGGAMNALGPLAKGLAFLMGKQPEEERHPRGFLGLEWVASAPAEPERSGLRVRLVLADSPAAKAGVRTDDQVLRINGRAVESPKAVRAALADVQQGDTVRLLVRRGSGADARELRLVLTAGEGL
jgi:serine protease Do